jgi:hypothetical protein
MGIGFEPSALPAAREARGEPAASASCRHLCRRSKDALGEAPNQRPVHRHVKAATSAGEVLVQLAPELIGAPRRVQDPRADPFGHFFQRRICGLVVVGDLEHAARRDEDEQLPQRRVQRRKGNVQQPGGSSPLPEQRLEAFHVEVAGLRVRQLALKVVHPSIS